VDFNAFLLDEGATFSAVMLLIKDRKIISECNGARIMKISYLEHKQSSVYLVKKRWHMLCKATNIQHCMF
jgi:hypothetical protein